MRFRFGLVGATGAAAVAFALGMMPMQASHAQEAVVPANDAASRFGALAGVQDISLSPDGAHIIFISPSTGQGNDLFITPTAEGGRPQRLLRTSGDPEALRWCNWKSDSRIICQIGGRRQVAGRIAGFVRYIALDAAGGNVTVLGNDEFNELYGGYILDWLHDDPDAILMGNGRGAIHRVSVADNRILARPETAGTVPRAYISDGQGRLRVMQTARVEADASLGDISRYFWRPAEGGQWQPLSQNDERVDDGFRPALVDAENNRVIGFQKVNGFDTVVARTLDAAGTTTTLFERQNVEIDSIITLGLSRRVVGVSFATDRRHAEYFDAAVGTMSRSLSRALGGRDIAIVDQNRDGTSFLVFASSDADPGTYFLYTPAARQLRPLLASHPSLAGTTLAPVRSVTYPAADGTMIPGYLTLPPGRDTAAGLPAIVMPHGGPSARDEGEYDFVAQYLASQGFAVLQPNYRGSSGYGDAWYVDNGFQSWRIAIGDVNDGGRWLVSQGADAQKLSIVGWSYGGYAALQSAVSAPELFRSVVAIAPVTDLQRLRRDSLGRFNGRIVRDFIGEGPHVREGSPALRAAEIRVPVLMFHGSLDTNVDIEQARAMRRALESAGRSVDLVEYEGLAHSLTTSEARTDMLRRISAFLPR